MVNAPASGDGTPLHFAAAELNAEACKALLDAGADHNLCNALGQTPAQVVEASGSEKDAQQCLKAFRGRK